jgi:hypothetical protein
MLEHVSHYNVYIGSPSFTSAVDLKDEFFGCSKAFSIKVPKTADKGILVSWSDNSFNDTSSNDFKSVKQIEYSGYDFCMSGYLAA